MSKIHDTRNLQTQASPLIMNVPPQILDNGIYHIGGSRGGDSPKP